jgi:hypothetical protein
VPLRTGIENPQHCFQAASSAISFPMRAIARLISRKGRTCTIGGWFELQTKTVTNGINILSKN